MKKSITINIPEPCHEGWQNMTPTQKGRFCTSCEKEVIDFSNKRDEELVKELAGKTNICGRFKSSQLNREVKMERKSYNSLLPYAASLLVPLSLMGSNPTETDGSEKNFVSLGIGRYSNANNNRIQVITSGKITDAHGKPLFNVEISVKESGRSVVSGIRGDYQIKSLDRETLIFKKDGFVAQEVKLTHTSTTINIKLHPSVDDMDIIVLGGLAAPISELPPPPPAPAVDIVVEETLGDVAYEIDEVLEGEIIAENIKDENIIPISTCDLGDIEIIEIEEITKEVVSGKISQEGIADKGAEEDDEATKTLIRGVVIDEQGLPLPGANVLVKGTATGTHADFDGNFEINANKGQVLEFSYVGFKTKEYNVKDVPENVTMVMDEVMLEGLVVTGIVGFVTRNDGDPVGNKYVIEPQTITTTQYTIETEQERKTWRQGIREAHANEIEYKRLQQARKKAARKLKRSKRKRK
ncbi:carboxypeptidase-like regulatory domain-containing protein [Pukyongia salina]|nr:carboxypeptidase-like regulatory domain-containing protein [Pukyongia salina]